jgi:hypothetical protein
MDYEAKLINKSAITDFIWNSVYGDELREIVRVCLTGLSRIINRYNQSIFILKGSSSVYETLTYLKNINSITNIEYQAIVSKYSYSDYDTTVVFNNETSFHNKLDLFYIRYYTTLTSILTSQIMTNFETSINTFVNKYFSNEFTVQNLTCSFEKTDEFTLLYNNKTDTAEQLKDRMFSDQIYNNLWTSSSRTVYGNDIACSKNVPETYLKLSYNRTIRYGFDNPSEWIWKFDLFRLGINCVYTDHNKKYNTFCELIDISFPLHDIFNNTNKEWSTYNNPLYVLRSDMMPLLNLQYNIKDMADMIASRGVKRKERKRCERISAIEIYLCDKYSVFHIDDADALALNVCSSEYGSDIFMSDDDCKYGDTYSKTNLISHYINFVRTLYGKDTAYQIPKSDQNFLNNNLPYLLNTNQLNELVNYYNIVLIELPNLEIPLKFVISKVFMTLVRTATITGPLLYHKEFHSIDPKIIFDKTIVRTMIYDLNDTYRSILSEIKDILSVNLQVIYNTYNAHIPMYADLSGGAGLEVIISKLYNRTLLPSPDLDIGLLYDLKQARSNLLEYNFLHNDFYSMDMNQEDVKDFNARHKNKYKIMSKQDLQDKGFDEAFVKLNWEWKFSKNLRFGTEEIFEDIRWDFTDYTFFTHIKSRPRQKRLNIVLYDHTLEEYYADHLIEHTFQGYNNVDEQLTDPYYQLYDITFELNGEYMQRNMMKMDGSFYAVNPSEADAKHAITGRRNLQDFKWIYYYLRYIAIRPESIDTEILKEIQEWYKLFGKIKKSLLPTDKIGMLDD